MFITPISQCAFPFPSHITDCRDKCLICYVAILVVLLNNRQLRKVAAIHKAWPIIPCGLLSSKEDSPENAEALDMIA